ncbi:hypothetical protein Rt10032_c11g4549 [Rhodotorula toruloides]|uniref:Uncharacterized protein n=1 Tax=Rhodotorula toruloides TaxID=5286 RepID=A0A511KJH2_RHOTO|nr:hypothetical protein Rt10032_c11g4549 [Rhodotorula toruloides]
MGLEVSIVDDTNGQKPETEIVATPNIPVVTHAVPSGFAKEKYAPSTEDVLSADKREKEHEGEEERSRRIEAYKRGMEGLVLSALNETRKLDDNDLAIIRGNWRHFENGEHYYYLRLCQRGAGSNVASGHQPQVGKQSLRP